LKILQVLIKHFMINGLKRKFSEKFSNLTQQRPCQTVGSTKK
jgi:hypothetical protein